MVETGHFALVLAFALSLVQFVLPLVGARTGDARLMATAGPVAVTGFAMTAITAMNHPAPDTSLSQPVVRPMMPSPSAASRVVVVTSGTQRW